jgi:hypothetical protein
MFVVINLVFYFGLDSSDESEDSIEFDAESQIDIEKNAEFEQEISNSINP